jgi:hypothetical protein
MEEFILNELMFILAAGVLGGCVRSLIGWANTETTERFNGMKFIKSLIRASSAGLVIAYMLKEGHSGAKKILFSK